VRPRVLNSRCLTYFYICDLYTRRKKCLIVCLCACKKKKWNFFYLSSQNGLTDFCQILHNNSTHNVMIYPRRLLNIFSRFLFTEGSNLPYSIILSEWLLTQRSALPCIYTRDASFCSVYRFQFGSVFVSIYKPHSSRRSIWNTASVSKPNVRIWFDFWVHCWTLLYAKALSGR